MESQVVKKKYQDKKTKSSVKNKNNCKILHQKLHIRKQSIRKILKCNWYIKRANTIEIHKIKRNIKKLSTMKFQKINENIRKQSITIRKIEKLDGVQTNLENQGKPGKVVIFKVFQRISGKLRERF